MGLLRTAVPPCYFVTALMSTADVDCTGEPHCCVAHLVAETLSLGCFPYTRAAWDTAFAREAWVVGEMWTSVATASCENLLGNVQLDYP